MLKNKVYFLIVQSVLFLLLFNTSIIPQKTAQQKQTEHQTIIDFIQSHYLNYPVNTNPQNNINKEDANKTLRKVVGEKDRKSYIMNGNNVTCQVWNYGGIGAGLGGEGLRDRLDLVWRDLPYIFQFSPFVGASVSSALNPNQRIHIISDGMYDYSNPGLRDEDRVTGFKWTWQPLPGYADPDQDFMASNPAFDSNRDGKPDSWPREWYSEALGEYVWPGYLTVGENNADLETYWAMDDRDNLEFPYYPFTNDSSRKGLGVQIDGRAFQWSNSLASNALFLVWTITNVSDKDLDSVLFGFYGDPDLGGQSDNKDDNGFFIPPYSIPGVNIDNIPVYARSMVYFFDNPKTATGERGLPVYYLGCKFLESPGNPKDGIDNDGDGMIDESQDDGIDNDGDWNPDTDDVGIDGIPNTFDVGEGDGKPTAGSRLPDGRPDPLAPGEPNFEYTDLDEADQIGLTSFASSTWNTDLKMGDDEVIWNRNKPSSFSEITQDADIVFTFGSGYISLKKGETKRISMAFLFGENLNDLLTTAETVQDIYNKNYRFFKPPSLPKVTAVPEDKKVTLYWDSNSEESIDPITGKDFEGYVIYRSTRPDFADVQTVTDGRGSSFLYNPLKDINGFDAKWDLKNGWKGYHPVPYQGRGIHYYLGDDSGLRHSFVDSNNVLNGQTYYYAVVAYDHGDSVGIPPTETTKKISVDPITSNLIFDVNTTAATPGPRASGYSQPSITNTDVQHVKGYANGNINFNILDDLKLVDNNYKLTFNDTLYSDGNKILAKNYSVVGEKIYNESFYLYGIKNTNLSRQHIINDANLVVKGIDGALYQNGIDYIINYEKGSIKRTENSSMPDNSQYSITYRNYAVYQSQNLNGEDANPVFDGIKLKVSDYSTLDINLEKTKWSNSNLQIPYKIALTSLGTRKKKYPGDYIITFSDQKTYPAKKRVPGKPLQDIMVNYKVEEVSTGISIPVLTLLEERAKNDTTLSLGDEIIFFLPGATGLATDTLSWGVTLTKTASGDSILPSAGDALLIYTNRPFTKYDSYTLQTKAGFVNNQIASSKMDNIYVVPNPYVSTNDIEPANKLPGQNRGERRIYFENLPMLCTIRIFTLSGELVTTIEHESGVDNGREYWNLLNKDGFSIAYGLYIAHIDAPGVGEKLIKFAIIK